MKMKNSSSALQAELETLSTRKYKSHAKVRGVDAVVYTRVSSQEQAENNGSLEVQLKYCNNYAKTNSIQIKEYFGGSYESAKTDGRKEFLRMIEYVKKHKNISYIIVFNYDRFSRTGAAASHISEELSRQGVTVKSVTQDIDTSTAIGRLQENFFHLLNNFDNRLKSDRTIINTKEVMLKGYWPYQTPLGYLNLKPKHRACFHEYVITESGKHLRKGFQMLTERKYFYYEIVDYLMQRGVEISTKSFRHVFSNPFYAGYVTGSLLGGKLIEGKHPKLIDLKTFLAAQDVLNNNPFVGVAKVFRHNEVPLKIFVKDEVSGKPFTGYTTRGNWYYKTKDAAIPVNVSSKLLNGMFVDLLSKYEYNPSLKKKLEAILTSELKSRLSEKASDKTLLKKKIAEKQSLLEKAELKYISDQITEDIYNKHAQQIRSEIGELSKGIDSASMSSSNIEKVVQNCLAISQNISQAWISAEYEKKQRLQKMVFPEGIMYNKQNGVVRTSKVNLIFNEIPLLVSLCADKEKGDSVKNRLKSNYVPRTGIEPALPCDNQILSLARLPVPPSGPLY
jgi:site-specific DNA recombinase